MRGNYIYSMETLFRITHDLKKAGKTIGITHGAFDLFHPVHLDLLMKSSKLCDFLIVGVDSDSNVEKYKSYKRPIIDQKNRMKIVNELYCVDAVFLNDLELNPRAFTDLYKELHVSLVTIGDHFGFEEVIKEQVLNAKANLVHVATNKRFSTSKIVNRILKTYRHK